MNLHLLHTLSGSIIVLSLLFKIIIHYYLDYLNDRRLGPNSIMFNPIRFLILYKALMNTEHNKLKFLCNSLLIIAYISLCVNFIVGLLLL